MVLRSQDRESVLDDLLGCELRTAPPHGRIDVDRVYPRRAARDYGDSHVSSAVEPARVADVGVVIVDRDNVGVEVVADPVHYHLNLSALGPLGRADDGAPL